MHDFVGPVVWRQPPEQAGAWQTLQQERQAELGRVEGSITGRQGRGAAGGRGGGGQAGTQPRPLWVRGARDWPCFRRLVQRWPSWKWRSHRGAGACSVYGGRGAGALCEVRHRTVRGAWWRAEVRGRFSSRARGSLLPHKARRLSTSVSPEKISFDGDFQGFFNLGKSTGLHCV